MPAASPGSATSSIGWLIVSIRRNFRGSATSSSTPANFPGSIAAARCPIILRASAWRSRPRPIRSPRLPERRRGRRTAAGAGSAGLRTQIDLAQTNEPRHQPPISQARAPHASRNCERHRSVVADMPLSSGSLQKKLKTALNETRLLVLGGQILLGFQFQGVFQESFSELSPLARGLDAVALLLMVTTLGLLIAPSMQHRIVEQGRTSERIFRVTGYMAGAALLPFAISLGIDHYAVFERLFGAAAGYLAGTAFLILALVFWYGLEYFVRRAKEIPMSKSKRQEPT